MTSSIECKNFLRSLQLLNLLIKIGDQNLIICPGSRSAPLAIAAGELNKIDILCVYSLSRLGRKLKDEIPKGLSIGIFK